MKKHCKHSHVLFLGAGVVSLFWFCIRVIPKPSRASYPCMRAAAPLASGFIGWIIAGMASLAAFKGAKKHLRELRYGTACLCILSGLIAAVFINGLQDGTAHAEYHQSNIPIGDAKGINPGRVVWVHDTGATDWGGVGSGHWWESGNTNQFVVEQMLQEALCRLSGEETIEKAWDALFRQYNRTHQRPDTSFRPGEKIMIKTNFVGCVNRTGGWCGVNAETYDLETLVDYMNTSPQVIVALLRQLVHVAGARQSDITVGDPTALFPNQYYDLCATEFPDVNYLDNLGRFGRTKAQRSAVPVYWSSHPAVDSLDYTPLPYVEADYLINVANFKSHSAAGVTFCAKNNYGSLIRLPDDSGYYDMHMSLPLFNGNSGQYRAVVDLMGHEHIGGKTVLYLVDGLYSGVHERNGLPRKWDFNPFNGDWTSSLFVSQDPVAIECVLFDIMQEEGASQNYPKMPGAGDYLLEAAQAGNPPSGTFYNPDNSGDVSRLTSLGVFEHWNNSSDMQYSRNLYTGDGIELILIDGISGSAKRVSRNRSALPGSVPKLKVPSPLRAMAPITLIIPRTGAFELSIFDIRGRLIQTLYRGLFEEGTYVVFWDGRNNSGKSASKGFYYIHLTSDDMGTAGNRKNKFLFVQ